MAVAAGGAVKSVQKVGGAGSPGVAFVGGPGSVLVPVAMPAFAVADPSNAFCDVTGWRVTAGALPNAPFWVYAIVTGINQLTLIATSPVAFNVTLQLEGRVVEYAGA